MKKITIILIILIVLAGVAFVYYKNSSVNSSENSAPQKVVNINSSYTLEEVSTHSVASDCWIAINGKVYNATDFIASGKHNDKILNGCGKDATEMFSKIPKHAGPDAQSLLEGQFIGVIK